MPDIKEDAPVAEDNATPTVPAEVDAPEVAPPAVPAEVETPIGDLVDKVEKRTVDQSVFVSEKKARKAAEKELKTLKASIENGASDADVSQGLADLAKEHDIDPKFLSKFAATIRKDAADDAEGKISEKFETKEAEATFDKAFAAAYGKAIEKAPDFKEMANPEIIKALALMPGNAKKTVSQLLEEIYGNVVPGKRSIETKTAPGGGKEPDAVDYDRAQNDGAYFDEIMASPSQKAKYNKMAIEKVTSML